MRILQISSAKNFGGGERHLLDLSKNLIAAGHDLSFAFAPRSPIAERMPEQYRKNIFEVEIKNALDIFSARRIACLIREKNIEIVHAHIAKDYVPASLAVRLAPAAKLIITRHVLFPMKFAQKYALANVSKVIAVSAGVERVLRKTFPERLIDVVPNGISLEQRSAADDKKNGQTFRLEHDISTKALIIGIVGELKPLKGQRDFVLAAQIIAGKFPEAFFIVVGKDNSLKKEFRRELKRLVKVFGLEDRFLFLDWIEDTAPLLAAIDVYVSASHSESFGLAILEAMASGKAIVSTDTEGAKELIENSETGKVVAVKDPLALADAIKEFLSDEKMREIYGENAQKKARELFSLNKMITKTEAVYKSVLV